MNFISKAGLAGMLALFAVTGAQADEVHYIGFNKLAADGPEDSGGAFNEYIVKLRPIMERYGMTVSAYDVLHGGSGELPADVVTFGTASDQERFQAFFEDAAFQEIFPTLVGALSDHHVIFTEGPFSVTAENRANTWLSLSWFGDDADTSIAAMSDLNDRSSAVFDRYGAIQHAESRGIMANRGLAAEITPTAPPELLELWSIEDAHGFFEDPLVRSAHSEARELLSRSESFWLRRRKIR